MAKDNVPSAPELPGARKVTITSADESSEFIPKPTREETILQSASEQMQEDAPEMQDSSPSHPPLGPKPKRSFKKVAIIVLALLFLAALGYGGWYVVSRKKPVDTNKANTQGSMADQEQRQTYTPENVIYAFSSNMDEPYSIYYRPTTGGDRKEVIKLGKNEAVVSSDVNGQKVVFASTEAIYVSADGGKAFEKILTINAGEQITSVALSQTGKRLVYGFLADGDSKNVIKSIDLNGKDGKDLFTSEKAGVYFYGWDEEKNLIAYSEVCFQSDGGRSGYFLRDLKANTTKELLDSVAQTDTVQHDVAVSSDFTSVVYVVAGPDDDSQGIPAGAPPYRVTTSLIGQTGKTTIVATVGTKGEKNANGTNRYRDFRVGYLAGTATPYYLEGTDLNKITGDKLSLAYQADKKILDAYFVNDKNVIVATGDTQSDFLLSNYSLADKESTQIFSGDFNTTIIGITTK